MPLTFTAEQKNELRTLHKPEYHRKASVIKNPYNADTRETIDISEHVESWGRINYSNTLFYKAWEMPNLTVVVVNQNNRFTERSWDSIWWTGPLGIYSQIAIPRECHLLVQIYLLRNKRTEALKLLEYRGRIDDIIYRRDEEYSVAEIVTIMEQSKNLNERTTKEARDHWAVCARGW